MSILLIESSMIRHLYTYLVDWRTDNLYLRETKKLVNVWTVNIVEEVISLLDLGVNGIITDDPQLVRNVITKKNEHE